MKKIKDMSLLGIIIAIFLGSIIYNAYELDTHGMEIAKERISSAKRVVIALHEFKKYDVDKKYVYNYEGKKCEIVKEITDKEEVEKIKNIVLKAHHLSNEVKLDGESAMLIQFYDESNKRLVEYDMKKITLGYNNRSFEVEIPLEDYDKLNKYFNEYREKIDEYLSSQTT